MTRNNDSNPTQSNRVRTREQNTSEDEVKPPSQRLANTSQEASDNSKTESDASEIECPECGGNVQNNDQHGEQVCDDCGLVVDDDTIDRGPEWRAYDSQEREQKRRVGSPVNKLMHDDGLTTQIDWKDKDAHGNSISSKQREKMRRLRKWDKRMKVKGSKEQNLKQSLTEIQRMASALGIPRDVQKIASMIYRQCLENELLPGRSIEGMTTASLYAATRMEDIPRSLSEMEHVSRVDEKEIGRSYRYLNQELQLEIGPSDPLKYIPRFIGEIDVVNQETERLARRLVKQIKGTDLQSGKSPPGIAAASIYMAGKLCGNTPTQKELADVTGVTEVTIRDRYQEMIDHGAEEWIHGNS